VKKKIVLMTGAAGGVGGHLRRALATRYDLVLSDVRPLPDRAKGEHFKRADLARFADVARVTKGVDAIIHLGGYAVEGPWEAILDANIVGAYNLFEAARRNGVKRVVFASSHHAVGFHRRERTIDHAADVRPDTRYGVSKVFGEALGRLYADKYGLEVFCIRIGNVNPAPIDKRRLSLWSSPRDLAQLVSIGLDHPDVRFEIVYGVSGNRRTFYDNANAERLGYRPRDDSEPHAAALLAREPPGDPIADLYQGGHFTVAESIPNPAARKNRKTLKTPRKRTR
jgi:uronate dehydrogenase